MSILSTARRTVLLTTFAISASILGGCASGDGDPTGEGESTIAAPTVQQGSLGKKEEDLRADSLLGPQHTRPPPTR